MLWGVTNGAGFPQTSQWGGQIENGYHNFLPPHPEVKFGDLFVCQGIQHSHQACTGIGSKQQPVVGTMVNRDQYDSVATQINLKCQLPNIIATLI